MSRLAIVMIRGYQRYISPYKGYSCARRLKHGGDSCSVYARTVFADEDWRAAWGKLRTRFRECRAASQSLRAERLDQRDRDEYFDAPPGDLGKSPPEDRPTQHGSGGCGPDLAVECCCSPGFELIADMLSASVCS